MLLLASALLASRSAAAPGDPNERSITLGVSGGLRVFNSQLGLQNNAAAGLRVGLGVTERLTVSLDYVFSAPVRENTDVIAGVSALRSLLRVDLMAGRTRPYLIAGVGGVMFNFGDARDFSTGTLTGGLGISHRFDRRHSISIEATEDAYRARTEEFTLTGSLLRTGPRTTNGLGTIAGGFAMTF